MAQNKYIFNKTHDMNKEEFAKLLNAAKGARTMKDFSESCGVNPSTFTRIIQKANKGASSTQLLEAIAKNANPQSGVTLDALAQANGYTLEIDTGSKYDRSTNNCNNMETLVRNILVQELIDRNAEVRMGNIRYNIGKTMALSPDALIMTNAFGKDNEIWFVDSILIMMDTKSKLINKTSLKRMTFNILSRFSFISMNKDKWMRPSRFSLVFFNKEAYGFMVEEFAQTNVPTYISLILIDVLNSTISDEFVLPSIEDEQPKSYFMNTSKTDAQGITYLGSDDSGVEELKGGII